MLAMRRYSIVGSLLLFSLLACDRRQPVEPIAIEAASSGGGGSTVNAPSNAQLVAISSSRIDASWQDNSTNEKGFEVWRSPSGVDGTFIKAAATGANVTTYSDATVDPSPPYCYKVRAFRRADGKPGQATYSAFSASACAPAGEVQVTATTTGAVVDPDGYSVTLEALIPNGWVLASWSPVATNGTVTLPALRAGDYYRVTLGGIAPNCAISTANPQAVTVSAGGTAIVAFTIACSPTTGSVRVTTATTGTDLDPDGFNVSVDGGFPQPIATNGAITIPDLQPASHVVSLGEVAENCEVTGTNPQVVSVTAGATTEVAFAIACAPVTQLAFMTQWAADGSLIDPDIYVINSNGTGAIQLTADPWWDAEPAWSPDGNKIAFGSDRDGNAEIYVMNADGSNPVRLTNDAASDDAPAWSPDGGKIAFTSHRDGNAEIYVMNADGSNPVRLTNQPGWDANPAWSPDGGKIAFGSGNGAISVMNADGSAVTELTSAGSQPAWSPDGTKIAFARAECWDPTYGMLNHIFVMNADGSGVTALTSCGGDATDPAWSPDGRKLAYSDWEALMVVNADGTNAVFLRYGFNPAWRP